MPTPGGLPKVGEVWELTRRVFGLTPTKTRVQVIRFVVLERGRGDYWSLRVYVPGEGRRLWVDATYYFKRGEFKYIGPAGPETKKKLGLR